MIKVLVVSVLMSGSYVNRTIYLHENEIVINEKYYLNNSTKIIEEKSIYYVFDDNEVQEFSNQEKRINPVSLYKNDTWQMEGWPSKIILEESLNEQINGNYSFTRKTNYGNEQYSLLKDDSIMFPGLFNLSIDINNVSYAIVKLEVFYKKILMYKSDLIETRIGLQSDLVTFNSIKDLFI
ncbi:MAG: hypothetical protein AAGA77_01860 [Bacteroidota bacterium]